MKHHIDCPRYDRIRAPVYRAPGSLEKRGLVVSFTLVRSRSWAVPERLKKNEMGRVKIDREG